MPQGLSAETAAATAFITYMPKIEWSEIRKEGNIVKLIVDCKEFDSISAGWHACVCRNGQVIQRFCARTSISHEPRICYKYRAPPYRSQALRASKTYALGTMHKASARGRPDGRLVGETAKVAGGGVLLDGDAIGLGVLRWTRLR